MRLLIFLVSIATFVGQAYSAVIYVNSSASLSACVGQRQCPTIKSALALASDNDIVYLNPGEYSGANNTNICMDYVCTFKNVSLVGLGDPSIVVITGIPTYSTFPRGLNVSYNSFSLVSNLTLTGFTMAYTPNEVGTGISLGGAALLVHHSVATLRYLVFSNNTAVLGGAIMVSGSDVLMEHLLVENNRATSYGGGMAALTSNCSISQSVFVGNNVTSTLQDLTGAGGAVHFTGTEMQSLSISLSSFINNTAQRSGGALHLEPSGLLTGKGYVRLSSCSFLNNGLSGLSTCLTTSSCDSLGGAVYISATDAIIENSDFFNNYALVVSSTTDVGQGGAVFSTTIYIFKAKSLLQISGCNFTANTAAGAGGALFISNQNYNISATQFLQNDVFTIDPSFSTTPSQGAALWFSTGNLAGVITQCTFLNNVAKSGWGGAIYGTSASFLSIAESLFESNSAVSSYTNAALGGALMVTNEVVLSIMSSNFLGNFVRPNFTTIPLTYSGSGGAIYAQSVSLSISGSTFTTNAAYTGQFDSGSTGGAMVLEDCEPMSISNSSFRANFAAGYVGSSSYASSGNGGALYIKFSVADIRHCDFSNNWVSAGGVSNSMGGAVAVFFDYSSVAASNIGVQINNTIFSNNSAYGQLCSPIQAGTGGAIGIVGVATPAVVLRNVTFIDNVAARPNTNKAASMGGALSVSMSTNISVYTAYFKNNYALYGVGNDVVSITSTTSDYNYMYFYDAHFQSADSSLRSRIESVLNSTQALCTTLSDFAASYDSEDIASVRRRLHLTVMGEDLLEVNGDSSAFYDDMIAILQGSSPLGPAIHRELRETLRSSLLTDMQKKRAMRKLSGSNTLDNLSPLNVLNFLPGMALTAGSSTLEMCSFDGEYHIFVGNYGSLTDAQSGSDTLTVAQLSSELQILGNLSSSALSLTLMGSTIVVDLYDADDVISVSEVNIFNGTLMNSNNVFISDVSFFFGAKLVGIASRYWTAPDVVYPLPVVTFQADLLTGYTMAQAASQSRTSLYDIMHFHYQNITTNSSAQSMLTFDSINVVIAAVMVIDSPYRGIDNFVNITDGFSSFSNCKIELRNNATILITDTGAMVLFTSTSIVADQSFVPAIINQGNVSLLGAAASPFNRNGFLQGISSVGSLTSVLTIYGQFVQNTTGQLHLVLNTSSQSIPVMNLIDNFFIGGHINVTFSGDPSLVLYDSDSPSSFAIISYTNTSALPAGFTVPKTLNQSIIAPEGLSFKDELYYSSTWMRYQQRLVVENIACAQINTDYQGVSSSLNNNLYPCYVCLQNSSCALCESSDGSQYCADGGMCGAGREQYTSQCCESNCNHGSCQGNGDNTEFSCVCSGWFYVGTSCDRISTTGIIVIFSTVFLACTAVMVFVVYHRSATQKQQVLEELREGILRHTESANNEYILNMQQALILNDVFVKYDEIKLESKVGEGSFGVVHKATFRGAQVAVKQMRSMFVELTDKEIDEFRREAYVMSRLRHPNIVLVMGISLVDQEPVAFPKSRALNSVEDIEEMGPEKKKTKPQKTVCIITEYLEQGSLADILYGPTRLPAEIWTYELILACALQAARGMLYLHSHQPPICHRDLKSSNLVVDDHWVVKVTDFGMSRIVPEKVQELDKGLGDEDRESIGRDSIGDFSRNTAGLGLTVTSSSSASTGTAPSKVQSSQGSSHFSSQQRGSITAPEMTSNMGTTAWCAPEILTASNRTRYSVKVDVYSFGMVLWELWEKKRPFDEYSSRFDIMDAVRAGKRPIISENCPPAYKALIQRCWHTEPSRRPMFHYIVRYIKDELARVKLKKALPVPTSRASASFFRPSTSFAMMGGAPVSAPTDRASTLRKSQHVIPHEQSAGGDPINPMHDPAVDVPIGDSEGESEEPKFPEGRKPLVKAFDRSLSYLTESPGLDSPLRHMGGAHKEFIPAQIYGNNRNTISAYNNTGPIIPQSSSGRMSLAANNTWRDRYVMRFSGWDSAKPDTGLPPSLTAAPSSPMGSPPQNSLPSAIAGGEVGNAQSRQTASSPVEDTPSVFKLDPEDQDKGVDGQL